MSAVAPQALLVLRQELVRVIGSDAERTWLVGGVVRDALLSRPLLDVDVATSADPREVARAIAATRGGSAFPLGDEFGCWRVTGDGSEQGAAAQVDICPLRGDGIERDLAARDFTANALAVAVTGEPVLIDPHHGARDIEHGVVRMVSPASLDADPLRMLRAARIAHVLGWEVEPDTVEAIRSRSARISESAGERTYAELQQLLLHPEARRGWRLLELLGLDAALLPELAACRGIEQSRFHHLDVHDHTLAVLDSAEDLLAATDFWLPLPVEPGLAAADWSRDARLTVLLAALCHDLAKPLTRALRSDGSVSFVGHDQAGMELVDAIAARWRWPGSLRRRVRQLVGTHLELGYALHGPRDERARWSLRRTLDGVVPEALVLSVADRLATAGPDDRRRWMRAHVQLAREVWTDHWREVRDGVPEPLLDGRELAGIAGIELGPRVGELVELLAREQAIGAVRTREEAVDLVRSGQQLA